MSDRATPDTTQAKHRAADSITSRSRAQGTVQRSHNRGCTQGFMLILNEQIFWGHSTTAAGCCGGLKVNAVLECAGVRERFEDHKQQAVRTSFSAVQSLSTAPSFSSALLSSGSGTEYINQRSTEQD